MINTLKKLNLIIAGVALLVGAVFILQPQIAYAADASDAVCDALGATGNACTSGGGQVNNVLKVALNILSFVAGFIAIIMLIIAGLKFITSQGDAGKASSARNTVIYALIGITIVVFAQIIVRFVIDKSDDVVPPSNSQPADPPTQADGPQ